MIADSPLTALAARDLRAARDAAHARRPERRRAHATPTPDPREDFADSTMETVAGLAGLFCFPNAPGGLPGQWD